MTYKTIAVAAVLCVVAFTLAAIIINGGIHNWSFLNEASQS